MVEMVSITNNLKRLFNRLSKFPDLFVLHKQTNQNIDEYFETLGYSDLPLEFLAFISLVDGLKLDNIQIFSVNDNPNFITLKFEDYSSHMAVQNFCSNWINNKNYFFFASDSKGGRFAFDLCTNDGLVYYLSPANMGQTIAYGTFISWLEDVIEKTIQNSI